MREDQQPPPLLPRAEEICFRSRKGATKHQLHLHASGPTTISSGFHLPTLLQRQRCPWKSKPLEPSTGAEASPREGQFPRDSFPHTPAWGDVPHDGAAAAACSSSPASRGGGGKQPPKQIPLHTMCFETGRKEEEEKAKQRGSGSVILLKISAGMRCN